MRTADGSKDMVQRELSYYTGGPGLAIVVTDMSHSLSIHTREERAYIHRQTR